MPNGTRHAATSSSKRNFIEVVGQGGKARSANRTRKAQVTTHAKKSKKRQKRILVELIRSLAP